MVSAGAKVRMTEYKGDLASEASGDARHRFDEITYPPSAIHMVRTATGANLILSQMADQKASILMGAQFVVITIVIGQAGNGNFSLSMLCLALSAFVSTIFSILSVVPRVNEKPTGDARPNILFFGVFSQVGEDEFVERLMHKSETDGRILSTMLRDVHQNGVVLQTKKYRNLAYAYRVFQSGLCLTVLVFLYESHGDLVAAFS